MEQDKMKNKPLRELKELMDYKSVEQANGGITIRSLKEEIKEWDRCFKNKYGKEINLNNKQK